MVFFHLDSRYSSAGRTNLCFHLQSDLMDRIARSGLHTQQWSLCGSKREVVQYMSASSTWRPNGFWQLGNGRNLGIYANGLFGNDTIALSIQRSGGPTLEEQIMAVIGTEKIYVGMFAVNPKRTNCTGITEQARQAI